MSQVVESTEVLTLDEAASFLRVSPEAIMRLVVQQALPGRQIDGEWRFLRAAMADWLRERSGKAILLSQAGEVGGRRVACGARRDLPRRRGRPGEEGGCRTCSMPTRSHTFTHGTRESSNGSADATTPRLE